MPITDGSSSPLAPGERVCEVWASEVGQCQPCAGKSLDAYIVGDMLEIASEILYELSGRQFPGICTTTVRPCCQCNPNRCGCGALSQVRLGAYPLVTIDEVIVDGVTLDASRYRIDDDRWLVRLADADGTNPGWPACQDLALDSTEDDTFEVTFSYGQSPPRAGILAAEALACELSLACLGDASCSLPQRVQTITRQGITMAMLDPFQFLENGKTGLFSVDLWLTSINPKGRRRSAGVASPDMPPAVRRVGT